MFLCGKNHISSIAINFTFECIHTLLVCVLVHFCCIQRRQIPNLCAFSMSQKKNYAAGAAAVTVHEAKNKMADVHEAFLTA